MSLPAMQSVHALLAVQVILEGRVKGAGGTSGAAAAAGSGRVPGGRVAVKSGLVHTMGARSTIWMPVRGWRRGPVSGLLADGKAEFVAIRDAHPLWDAAGERVAGSRVAGIGRRQAGQRQSGGPDSPRAVKRPRAVRHQHFSARGRQATSTALS